jgi:hypothetical protein
MQHTLDTNLEWYRRNYRKNYDIIKMVRAVLAEKHIQFPDACCPHATRLLLELLPNVSLMCGTFKNAKMEKESFHVWIFDMTAKVHIDITARQFPIKIKSPLLFFRSRDSALLESVGYKLAPLHIWNEIFEMGPYYNYSLSKIKLTYDGKDTLADILQIIKAKLSC